MQLPGPQVWGPPRDKDAALAVLREVIELGANHIDTAEFYGPHIANQLIREALAPYPDDLVIVTKVGFVRGGDGSWRPDHTPEGLTRAVHDNLATLGLDVLDIVNLRLGGPHGPDDRKVSPVRSIPTCQSKQRVVHATRPLAVQIGPSIGGPDHPLRVTPGPDWGSRTFRADWCALAPVAV